MTRNARIALFGAVVFLGGTTAIVSLGHAWKVRPGGVKTSGTVRTLWHLPIVGAVVYAREESALASPQLGPSRFETVTDAQGSYNLELDDADYTIEVTHPGYAIGSAPAHRGRPRDEHVDITIVPAGSVSGRVLSRADGGPVAGAVVVSTGGLPIGSIPRGWQPPRATTDRDGDFVVRGLTRLSPSCGLTPLRRLLLS